MRSPEGWAGAAATLPTDARSERETPFWRELVERLGWHRVADAGCGSGFHLALLCGLGIEVVGFDRALGPLAGAPNGTVVVGDLLAPPLERRAFDAVICLGNTISLLPSRDAQRRSLRELAELLRPGGTLLLQGEDAGALVADGPVLRTRTLSDGSVHVRAFERHGTRVRMLAGVVATGGEANAHGVWILPTTAASLARMARPLGLRPSPLPVDPPGAGATWWVLLRSPSGSRPSTGA